eukprot:gene2311-2850_t
MDPTKDNKKIHRTSKAGAKANKKKAAKIKKLGQQNDLRNKNPKAFTFASANAALKAQRRTLDLEQKRVNLPVVDRSGTAVETPPYVVAVVGPPNVGKTTLIRSLVKNYTRHSLAEVNGPITIVAGKKRRLTFLECNNDLNSMIDTAKVADLVLLLIDASYGFEMETFEFLNILKTHGFPKVIGVLTHLDGFKNNKKLKKTKKKFKDRFWTEIYQGAKLFYLSGLIHGKYPKVEIHNLARFISVAHFIPLTWRNTHPYVYVDRMEDITDPEKVRQDSKVDRNICLYGYVRGTYLKPHMRVHIPGSGDYVMKSVTPLPDPCPLPTEKKRILNEKDRLIYAPMGNIGNILYDKDAVYINVPGNRASIKDEDEDEEMDEGDQLVNSLKNTKFSLDEKMEQSELKVFSNRAPIKNNTYTAIEEISDREYYDSDSEPTKTTSSSGSKKVVKEEVQSDGRVRRKVKFIDMKKNPTLGVKKENQEEEDEGESLFKVKKGGFGSMKLKSDMGDEDDYKNQLDTSKHIFNMQQSTDYTVPDVKQLLQSRFVDKNELETTGLVGRDDHDGEDQVLFGDFEDLETGQKFGSGNKKEKDSDDEEEESDSDNEDDKETNEDEDENENTENKYEKEREKNKSRKEKKIEKFNEKYTSGETDFEKELNDEVKKQRAINEAEFANDDQFYRQKYEGFPIGVYVRIEFEKIPCEFSKYFDPKFPLLVGGLLSNEENLGMTNVLIKKHRWHKKILKSNDPLIISLGWRRFQTLILYSTKDINGRNRMLKYTPEHMHCHASFYGPITPPGTPFIGFINTSNVQASFRVSATGTVLDLDSTINVVKKLKLTGTPYKIHKKTCFVSGMFNSRLEVAKFVGATLRTVSGIRGQIKQPLSSPEGAFRATFEDKVLPSDVIFLRTWYTITPTKFYNPVTSLLIQQKDQWQGMKTVGQLRFEKGLRAPQKKDSDYGTIERKEVIKKPLRIPKELQKELPFHAKPKSTLSNKADLLLSRRVVVQEPHEKEVSDLLKRLKTIKDRKVQKEDERRQKRQEELQQKKKKEDQEKERRQREEKKRKAKLQSLGKLKKKPKFG